MLSNKTENITAWKANKWFEILSKDECPMLDGMLIKSGVIFYAANNILHTLNNECYLMRPAIRLYVHIHIYIYIYHVIAGILIMG